MQDDPHKAAIDAHIQNDAFARFLGADVIIVAPGHSRVSLTVTDQMTNFHGITHGGLVFALGIWLSPPPATPGGKWPLP